MRLLSSIHGLLIVVTALACSPDDRMEDLLPEPDRRTEVYLDGIQHAMLSYWDSHSDLPEDLTALAAALEHHAVVEVDGWGNEMRYMTLEHGYCVWSAGADSLFGTPDDIAVAGGIRDTDLIQYGTQSDELRERCWSG